MINYFLMDEDFETIIKNTLKDEEITSIKNIPTGWTNIVYEVETNLNSYFFRFPRDDFWARTIVKDYEFSKFICGKTDFITPNLKLLYDKERPFSLHERIEGVPLDKKMDNLNKKEIEIISYEIAKFLYQLHNLKFNVNDVFKTRNIPITLADFLSELVEVHVDKKDVSNCNYKSILNKEHDCLVHGDLNSSNILLNDDNHVIAVIDYGFAGLGNQNFDLARIIGRCPNNFRNDIIKSYERISNKTLDYKLIDDLVSCFECIDNAYIRYMKKLGIYK